MTDNEITGIFIALAVVFILMHWHRAYLRAAELKKTIRREIETARESR